MIFTLCWEYILMLRKHPEHCLNQTVPCDSLSQGLFSFQHPYVLVYGERKNIACDGKKLLRWRLWPTMGIKGITKAPLLRRVLMDESSLSIHAILACFFVSKYGAELVHLVHNSALWNQTIFVTIRQIKTLPIRPSPGSKLGAGYARAMQALTVASRPDGLPHCSSASSFLPMGFMVGKSSTSRMVALSVISIAPLTLDGRI